MAIDSKALNQLLFDAFTGQTSWLEAASRYPLEALIDTFRHTRALMQKTVSDLTDAQAAYSAEGSATWSLSETITHLVYSQTSPPDKRLIYYWLVIFSKYIPIPTTHSM